LKRIPKKLPSLKDRRSGLLLHLSSLPGPYYCGDLGQAAYRFADLLAAGGQSWWQMLPVNPIGLGNSSYSITYSFAGDPLFIDLEGLVKDGLLKKSEIAKPQTPSPGRVYPNWRNWAPNLRRRKPSALSEVNTFNSSAMDL
jgi:4-alpha-glucanotransferase